MTGLQSYFLSRLFGNTSNYQGWALVALPSTVCTVCTGSVIRQYTGPDQCTVGFGEAETGRGEAATPASPPLVRWPRSRRPAGGTFLRNLASLELNYVLFRTMFHRQLGGTLTK